MHHRPHAFSLIELSIVLVILGLLVGGILAGQSLIRAGELRAVGSEYTKFKTASSAFRDKYFALPGDMATATSFWGIAGGTTGADSACNSAPSYDLRTCNGDGSGLLGTSSPGGIYETTRVWQHLTNAGLIDGRYIGTIATFAGYSQSNVPNVSVPPTKLGGDVFWTSGSNASYGNNFLLRNLNGADTINNSYPLRPEEAWNIDTKIDDGTPMRGIIRSNRGNGTNTNCTDYAASTPVTPEAYMLSTTTKDCQIRFLQLPG